MRCIADKRACAKRVIVLFCLLLIKMKLFSQGSARADTLITGKLIAFVCEPIPTTNDYWRTSFKFLIAEKDTVIINVPTDSTVPRAIFHEPFGICQLRLDSVYTLKLRRTKLSEIPVGLRTMCGFYYNDNDIVEDPVTWRIYPNPKAVRKKARGSRIMGTTYLDMNGFIYEMIHYWPYPCAKRHF